MEIGGEPAKEAGMLYVPVNTPPAPEFVVATVTPPRPRLLSGPMLTTKSWFGGKLAVWMVTEVSRTTLEMLKVGTTNVGGVTTVGTAVGAGTPVRVAAAVAPESAAASAALSWW